MSRPTAISPEEQEQIARRIGVLLLQAAPEDWQQITVEYRATGEYHDLLGEIVLQEGGAGEPWEPPEELLEIFEHLREGMYRPDVGTWLSALYIVEKPSSYRIDINFDAEPRWQRPLPRAAYIDELRRYPRAEENVPDWLREKLEGSGASTQPAASETTESPSTSPQASAAPVEPAEATAGNFRTAAVFDDFDEHGRPLVTTRVPVSPEEQSALRQYLESAPIVLASRDNEADLLHPEQPGAVPATWHTDGVWMWQGAVPYYLAQYAVPPEAALIEHIRARGFALAEIDDRTRDAATRELFERSAANEQRADGPQSGDQEVPSGSDGAAAPDGIYPEMPVAEESHVPSREVSAATAEAPDAEPHYTEADFRSATDESGDESDLDLHGDPVDPADAPAHTGESTHVPVGEVESEDSESDLAQRTSERVPFGSAVGYEADPAPAVDETAENAGLTLDAAASDEDQDRADFDESDSWNSDAEPLAGTRHERADAELQEDDEAVLALLHDKLTAFGVGADHYRIGSHTPDAHCLLRDGEDWVVTTVPDDHPGEDVRFSHSEQAAAYLLGSLLFAGIGSNPDRDDAGAGSSINDERAEVAESADQALLDEVPAGAEEPEATRIETPDEAPLSDADQPEDGQSERDTPTAEQPDIGRTEPDRTDVPAGLAQATAARAEAVADTRTDRADEPATASAATASSAPEQPQRSESGGHFLFTANQGPPPETETEAPAAAPAAQEPQPGEEATRFHQAPRPEQPAPPMGQQPPAGQQPTQAVPTGPPNQGQQPGGLPKRPPRPDQGGRPPAGGPAPQGPPSGGQPGPGAPGAGGPPMQAPGPVSGPMNRPPQQQAGPGDPAARPQQPPQQPPQPPAGQPAAGAQPPAGQAPAGQAPAGQQPQSGQPGQPGQAPAQPNAGAQIQPLRGEPPLTLYRDRRPIMLQPGTDLDRFGEPAGNVTYAARTPFAHRSLPPQWSNRPYIAYRVQRPIQVLRGTAVPWFEQPGGGTAYVLPTAISDLIADGTLIELAGNEASPPPMD